MASNFIANQFKALHKKLFPTALSPEKKYGYALVAAMALVASADGVLDPSETEAAKEIINRTEEINKYLTTEEANKAFKIYIDNLVDAIAREKTRFDIAVNLLLQKIPYVEKEEWKQNILDISREMAMADGILHEDEEKMIERIASSLWQSYKEYVPGM
ncbi:MAG: TerB family tellurite resistance protein [SAR324 cluster bacterium]|nr:TerB family tellurite resistance protein [SAR324 cluster bacterium]